MSHLSSNLPTLLSSSEVADLLGLKPQTLRKWRLQGDGPRYIRLGHGKRGRVVYRLSDLRVWLEQRTFSHTAEEESTS